MAHPKTEKNPLGAGRPKKTRTPHTIGKPPPGQSPFNKNTRDKILVAIRLGAPLKFAAAYAGVRRETIHKWVRDGDENPEGEHGQFALDYHKAKGHAVVGPLGLIQSAAREDWRAAAWLLDHQKGFVAESVAPGFKIPGQEGGTTNVLNQQTNVVFNLQDESSINKFHELLRRTPDHGPLIPGGNGDARLEGAVEAVRVPPPDRPTPPANSGEEATSPDGVPSAPPRQI